ncbi:hypothetical protein LV164_003280 [Aspergillus fumigatus]|nr:hypothetical protein LV157_002523 [Aspergillus fumigatus]KAJ8210477.1 hypothetical protein LV164_003280 [Aspergillus fumigatus]
MNMSPNEMMFNVDTTITACATCVNDLNLKSMCAEELMKMEMDMYKLMVERTLAISSSIWCINENIYATMWRFNPVYMQKPEKMFMSKSPNKTMSLRICVDENNTTVVTPSVIEYRNRIMNKLALMSPPSTPVRR